MNTPRAAFSTCRLFTRARRWKSGPAWRSACSRRSSESETASRAASPWSSSPGCSSARVIRGTPRLDRRSVSHIRFRDMDIAYGIAIFNAAFRLLEIEQQEEFGQLNYQGARFIVDHNLL